MKPEINKNIELVQILLYLADVKDMTRQSLGNTDYCSAIDDYFAPYKEHPAVAVTQDRIINHHFNYARPHKAALRFSEIAKSEDDELHIWATEVRRFQADTKSDVFFESQSKYYQWILDTINDCRFDAWIQYIEQYFHDKPDDFRLIICPLDGNYGFNLRSFNGKVTSYTIRCMPHYENGKPIWKLDFFAKGIAHEYAHCFVNPVVESNQEILKAHHAFFTAHKKMLDYYNTDYAVINEYFVRAFAIRFMEKQKIEGFDIKAEYDRQRESFIFIDRFVNALKEYEISGKTFSIYYIDNMHRILSEAENT